MKDIAGKTAVITGAGGGIGRGTALALAEAGMSVVVSDIDADAAASVTAEIEQLGGTAIAVRTDVADPVSVIALADAAYDSFGSVHVLHNNAGVAPTIPLDSMTLADWRWVLSVNLGGVIHGLHAFLGRLKDEPGEKHIVNTASMSGLLTPPNFGAYNASKFAVVAISETLRAEAATYGIGVSVLCPGLVATKITENTNRLRPGGRIAQDEVDTSRLRAVTPEEVGALVRRGIENDERYIFTHPEYAPVVKSRFDRIASALERAADPVRTEIG